ncbi:MAG: lamin tail domain-containing protein, partial [Phycisphaerae bacterium]|nr:lamin tail domain-containing protein [Phycisphaerae bacterium]
LFFGGSLAVEAADPGDVVINEIMQNPNAVFDSAGEWFELYNATGADIDIEGWTISDNDIDSHTINNGAPLIIPAGGYLVLG